MIGINKANKKRPGNFPGDFLNHKNTTMAKRKRTAVVPVKNYRITFYKPEYFKSRTREATKQTSYTLEREFENSNQAEEFADSFLEGREYTAYSIKVISSPPRPDA